MKLIYLANMRLPTEKAHGIQIMKMCETFSRLGLEVELVVPWRFNRIKQDPFDYYGVERMFKITRLPSLDLVKFGKFGFLVQSLSFAKIALGYLFFKKTDIVYSRDELPLFCLSFFKTNIFWETHGGVLNFAARRVLKKCRGIISISQGLKDFYVKNDVTGDKILVASDGVDINKFEIRSTKSEIRSKLNLPQDKKIILYTGHLYEWKGARVLAEASQYLVDDCLIVFVGGTEKDIKNFQFSRLAVGQAIFNFQNKNILVVGYQPPKEIPFWLKAADVLVLPNSAKEKISALYTSPMKLFEYMASGIPIVASDLPSIREILSEKNAVLVKPDNSVFLAGGIKRALENQDFSDKISKQAYLDVQNYTWDKRAKKIYEISFNFH